MSFQFGPISRSSRLPMIVNFYASLRKIVGAKAVTFDVLGGSSVQQLINIIDTQYPELGEELMDNNGRLYSHVHVFVNGYDVTSLENRFDTVLSDQDTIDIFPAVVGG